MFCDDEYDIMQHTNTWRFGQGFVHPVSLTPSFKYNFHGREVIMRIGKFSYPMLYIKGWDKHGDNILDGQVYDNYVVLGNMLNLSIRRTCKPT